MQIDHHANTQGGCLHVDKRWLPQDGQQVRAVGRDQACRRVQLGAIRLAGEHLGINQAGREMIRG